MTLELSQRVGQVIRNLRLEQQLSQEDLADKCGLHRTYIGTLERGEKNMTIETALRITKALDISLVNFFAEIEKNDEHSE